MEVINFVKITRWIIDTRLKCANHFLIKVIVTMERDATSNTQHKKYKTRSISSGNSCIRTIETVWLKVNHILGYLDSSTSDILS